MPCKIGMTSDLERRKAEWKRQYPTLKNSEVLAGPPNCKEDAQILEMTLSQDYGCESHPGRKGRLSLRSALRDIP